MVVESFHTLASSRQRAHVAGTRLILLTERTKRVSRRISRRISRLARLVVIVERARAWRTDVANVRLAVVRDRAGEMIEVRRRELVRPEQLVRRGALNAALLERRAYIRRGIRASRVDVVDLERRQALERIVAEVTVGLGVLCLLVKRAVPVLIVLLEFGPPVAWLAARRRWMSPPPQRPRWASSHVVADHVTPPSSTARHLLALGRAGP